MTEKVWICITCPEGCEIRTQLDATGSVTAVSGNRCPRGERYVRSEAVHPVRQLSSTILLTGGKQPLVPVRAAQPIPKASIPAVMAEIRAARATAPVRRGQILLENAAGTGVAIIACADAE